ncbi:exonuclease domain-containing protein [Methylophaga sp.]|uniref:exonuclease domain-containing protein n=1 Tax=Methylophaga sp. TaxID=2024840 RepID=UPI002724648D|nr:exonuclease domain-containing protein [Methylophaga sp.]MDO8826830.1 exonuclease domain-containing protein [Methylophaga sp.]
MKPLLGFPDKMVLLDCETTGGNAIRDRLTEIALIEITNGVETDRWQTLINPGISIPPWISKLTGITDAMVAGQPTFAEIAEELQQRLADNVFVAHHVRFDYGFIRESFRRLGITFSAKTLCSVKISRLLYPEQRRHGIDAIVARLGLTINQRHRAMDDAQVILELLQQTQHDFDEPAIQQACQQLSQQTRLPSHLDINEINKLPERPGVYQFFDEQGALLYIGKSVNIKQRVLSHFVINGKQRNSDIQQQLQHIDFIETPSDFGAQLLENQLIKSKTPRYNRRQTKAKRLYQIALATDENGYHRTSIEMADLHQSPNISQRYGLFRSQKQAEKKLLELIGEHQLCQKLCGLQKTKNGCFGYQLKKCRGACCGEEPALHYNLRLQTALSGIKNQVWPWKGPIVITELPADGDYDAAQFHLVDQWLYFGTIKNQHDAYERLQQQYAEPQYFDLDAYKIQLRFLLKLRPKQLLIENLRLPAEEA